MYPKINEYHTDIKKERAFIYNYNKIQKDLLKNKKKRTVIILKKFVSTCCCPKRASSNMDQLKDLHSMQNLARRRYSLQKQPETEQPLETNDDKETHRLEMLKRQHTSLYRDKQPRSGILTLLINS